jgi:glycogen synthase
MDESKRILLVPSSFAPKVGGLETAVAHLATELTHRGHTVAVLTNRYPRTLAGYERIDDIPVYRYLMTNTRPGREQLSRLGRYLLGIALAPIQLARITLFVRKFNPEIINAHFLEVSALYAYIASKFHSTRFVVSVHGSDLLGLPCPSGQQLTDQLIVRGAHAATACSAYMAECLKLIMEDSWGRRIVVTGNGVDPSELQTEERFEHPRPYLFTAARLVPKKGLNVLIRAMRNLVDGGFNVDLILAGSGPQEKELRNLASALNLETRVYFYGAANRRQLAALLNGCTLFVLPSLMEGLGIAILEAMVCGKAVVASDCGGIPEIVRDNETGLLVPPGDVEMLSQTIAALLSDSARRQLFGEKGRAVALSEFQWSAVTDRYLQAYRVALAA